MKKPCQWLIKGETHVQSGFPWGKLVQLGFPCNHAITKSHPLILHPTTYASFANNPHAHLQIRGFVIRVTDVECKLVACDLLIA